MNGENDSPRVIYPGDTGGAKFARDLSRKEALASKETREC